MKDPMELEVSAEANTDSHIAIQHDSTVDKVDYTPSVSGTTGKLSSEEDPSLDKQRKRDEKKAAKAAKAARALAKAEGAIRHPWQLEREAAAAATAAAAAAADDQSVEGGGEGEPRRKRRGWKHRLEGQDGEAALVEPAPETLDPAAPHWRELTRVLADLQRQAASADQPPSWALPATAPGGGRRTAAGPVLASVIKSTLLQARRAPPPDTALRAAAFRGGGAEDAEAAANATRAKSQRRGANVARRRRIQGSARAHVRTRIRTRTGRKYARPRGA